MKKGISLLLAITLILSMGAASFAQINDISTHWASQEINYLVERGVLNGYPDGTFRPDNPMTKVEFYKVINKLLDFEETVEVTYLDVNSTDWYYENVGKALAAGYISSATLLLPNENITRQEVARILGVVYNLNDVSDAAKVFLDSTSILPETKGYIGVLLENSLLHGYPDGTFKPTANITRAEVVKLIYNVLGKLNDLSIKVSVDKSELEESIEDVEDLSKSKYTNATWKKLEIALEEAIDVFENKDATQAEVEEALGDLLDAMDDLKKVSTSSDRDTSESSDSRYTLMKGTNNITTPVTIRTSTVTGNVIIDYTRSADLNLPAGLTIDGNLIVIAPQATVNNYATVTGEIIIKDVASTTWNEYADGNTLIIEDENGLVLNIVGDVDGITVFETAYDGIVITVAEGSIITSFEINAPVTIILKNPIGATIRARVDVTVKTSKDATGSTVTGTGEKVILNPEIVAVSSITVPTDLTLMAGGATATITVRVFPENATNKAVTWTSSDTTVATVSKGIVTSIGAGTATITATSVADRTKTATTSVHIIPIEVSGITVTPTIIITAKSFSPLINATIFPANATNKNVVWSSSNTSVATVVNGEVTLKTNGVATITATTIDGGKTATTFVSVVITADAHKFWTFNETFRADRFDTLNLTKEEDLLYIEHLLYSRFDIMAEDLPNVEGKVIFLERYTSFRTTVKAARATFNNLQIAIAKELIAGVTYTMTQETATNEDIIKSTIERTIEREISAISLYNEVSATVNKIEYKPAVAADAVDPTGINGTYTFTVEVSNSSATGSTATLTMTIIATPFVERL